MSRPERLLREEIEEKGRALDQLLEDMEYWRSRYHNLESQLVERDREIARLKREGVPGVMHAVDKAFYDLTVTERDYERQTVDALKQEIARLRDALAYLANPESWQGNPHDHASVLLGHFTPHELARETLGPEHSE
jgi:chromosome segregation ATPase